MNAIPARLSRLSMYHLATGVIFSLALCAYLLAGGYRASVIEASSKVETIRANSNMMAKDAKDIMERQAKVALSLPAGYGSNSPRELMLLSVERLKAGIKGASVSLEEFNESGAALRLPLIVEFDTASFEEGVKALEALRSSRLPSFEFSNIDIRRLDGSYSSARHKIEGAMTMPIIKAPESGVAGESL